MPTPHSRLQPLCLSLFSSQRGMTYLLKVLCYFFLWWSKEKYIYIRALVLKWISVLSTSPSFCMIWSTSWRSSWNCVNITFTWISFDYFVMQGSFPALTCLAPQRPKQPSHNSLPSPPSPLLSPPLPVPFSSSRADPTASAVLQTMIQMNSLINSKDWPDQSQPTWLFVEFNLLVPRPDTPCPTRGSTLMKADQSRFSGFPNDAMHAPYLNYHCHFITILHDCLGGYSFSFLWWISYLAFPQKIHYVGITFILIWFLIIEPLLCLKPLVSPLL